MATEYTTNELAALLGLSPQRVHYYAQHGALHATRRGHWNVFSESEVARFRVYHAALLKRERPQKSEAERFWSLVEKTESHWLWRGGCDARGVPVFPVGEP